MNPRLLARLLAEIRLQVDSEMSVQRLQVLMHCMASPDGVDQQGIPAAVDQSRSAVSKNLADLSELTSKKTRGPGLLRSDADPMNLSTRIIRVTQTGRQVWADILRRAGFDGEAVNGS